MSGIAATVLVAGVATGTAASGVSGEGARSPRAVVLAAGALPADAAGVSIGLVGGTVPSTPETLDQIFAVLERAERAAHENGREITPAISQAAAELGMLLTAYLAQQDEVGAYDGLADGTWSPHLPALEPWAGGSATPDPEPLTPLRPADVPGPTAADAVATDADDGTASPHTGTVDPDDGTASPDAATADTDAATADPDPATTDPDPATTDTDPATTDDPALDLDAVAAEQVEVTFDDVVLAAMRLATLLDAEGGAYRIAVGTVPGSAADTPLTTMLREAVERYGRSTEGYANGRIPTTVLCALPFAPGHRLRCDAASQLVALNEAYVARFGRPIPMTDSYRTIESQIRLKAQKPRLAATPGRSLHGWGIAVDLAAPISSGTSPEYLWMRLNGPDYGWDNPSWARLDGSKPEPWHFEFFAAGPVPNRALSSQDVALYRAASQGSTGTTPDDTTQEPPMDPTPGPTPPHQPSAAPTPTPTPQPTPTGTVPTPRPSPTTPSPSPEPSPSPSPDPSPSPSPDPTTPPSPDPTTPPSPDPTTPPSPDPTTPPSPDPSPSTTPSASPSNAPTDSPSGSPTDEPTAQPTDAPSDEPTDPGTTPPPAATLPARDPSADAEPEAGPPDPVR